MRALARPSMLAAVWVAALGGVAALTGDVAAVTGAPLGAQEPVLAPPDTTSFKVESEALDSNVAPRVAEDTRAGRDRVESFFEAPFPQPVVVRVFPDRASLDEYTTEAWGFATECWMVGAGATRTLLLLSPRVWGSEACDHDPDDPAELSDLIAHELVHVYHMQNNPSNEFEGADEIGWFVEGLATYVSGQLDRGHRGRAREAIATGAAPARLADAWTGAYRYGVSGTLVEYIDVTWGREVLNSLLGATSQTEILAPLGVDEAGLLAGWRQWLSSAP